ncbi:MAG: hypothetical protein HC802_13915, partial [Caldilineaceae bacterium]|nr:hypothetical protein [Caldilineaceae bacterium]
DRIREVAYQQISRARCRLLHRQVAKALETIHADELDDVTGELAAHYAQAGNSNKACQYYRQAADVALAQYAYGRAETMIQAALLHIQNDPLAQVHLLSRLDVVLFRSVQLERWARNLNEQQALVDALSPPDLHLDLMVRLSRCEYFRSANQGEQLVSTALAALHLAESLGDALSQAHAYLYLGEGHWLQAHAAESMDAYHRVQEFARLAGDLGLEAQSLEMRAQTAMFTGVPAAEIYDWLLRAYELAELTDDIIRKHSLLNKIGYWRVARGLGELDQAEQEYRQAAEWSRQRGNREHERNLWSNLGVVYTLKGDYRAAFDAFDAALETSSTSKIHYRYWVTRHYLGAGLMQMGQMQRAPIIILPRRRRNSAK